MAIKNLLFNYTLAFVVLSIGSSHAQDTVGSNWKLFIFLHQDCYVPGDTAYYNVSLLNDHQLAKGKYIVRFNIISQGGKMVFKEYIKLENGFGYNQIIFPTSLQPGSYLLSATINGSVQPIYQQFVMLSGEKNLNPDSVGSSLHVSSTRDSTIEILGIRAEYKPRQKVDVEIKAHLPMGELIGSKVAIRVISKKAFASSGLHAQPRYLIGQNQKQSKSTTHRLVGPSNRIVISGKVFYEYTKQPVPDSTHVATYLLKNQTGYDFRTGQGGLFEVPFYYDFYGNDKLFAAAEIEGKVIPVSLDLESDQSPKITLPEFPDTDFSGEYASFKAYKHEIDKSYFFYRPENSGDLKQESPGKSNENISPEPDITVELQDYLIFPKMEDVVNEVVPALSIRKKGDDVSLRMNLLITIDKPILSKNTPLLIIDGVLTKDLPLFLNINPADVISFRLIRKMSKLIPWGVLGQDGIIFISTKNPKIGREILDRYPGVKGLTMPISYKTDGSTLKKDRIPDLRTSLYWNPELRIDPTVKNLISFYTPDNIGEFLIEVFGITRLGEPIFSMEKFEVKMSRD